MTRRKRLDTTRRWKRAAQRACVCVVALFAVCMPAPAAYARSEDQVKAAFLFNFARYVEWPAEAFSSAGGAIRICTFGAGTFSEVVARIVGGKKVGARAVEVAAQEDLSGIGDCHILFLGEEANPFFGDVLASLSGASVFTVADSEEFVVRGGIASFFRAENRVRFEINPQAAKRAGLKVSSQLLRLARIVD